MNFLILHRAQAADANGEWAWTPPTGARYPGETIHACAEPELFEETGLRLLIAPVRQLQDDWALYRAKAPRHALIMLDAEHDRYAWVSSVEGSTLCTPAVVGVQITEVAAIVE